MDNKELNKIEQDTKDQLENEENEYDYLYPNINDPLFNIKIAEKKEFQDAKADNIVYTDIEKRSNELCKGTVELMPHQMFVRNFLNVNTPYNSLLLFHGLGTGKTCSSITIAEEMRLYNKQHDTRNKIYIIASPNVQNNFKNQLFNENNLELINGNWVLKGCNSNAFINEINPLTVFCFLRL